METEIKLTKLASCAGCGAKVGAGTLAKLLGGLKVHQDPNLLVGFDKSDDGSVYQISPELALVQTVDFFPPIDDDPYTFGAIAAANALSDIYAMGGEPKLALNIMAVPETLPQTLVQEILRGGYEKVYEAGAILTGGHSIYDPEPKYGLCVTGFVHPDRILTNAGAQPGDILLYTKPIGTGVLTTAARAQLVGADAYQAARRNMMVLNRAARDAMAAFRIHACTDVTGFGLLGHLLELTQASNVKAHIDPEAVSFYPDCKALAQMGILPAGVYRNRSFAEADIDAGNTPLFLQDLLYDPQTSGGLLMAVHPDDAGALLQELSGRVPSAQKIGEIFEYSGGKRIFLQS